MPVLATHSHRLAVESVQVGDDLLVDCSGEDHFGDLQVRCACHPQPVDERDLLPHLLHRPGNLRAAAMHDHGPHPQRLQQQHILREGPLEFRINHRRTSVLDHNGLLPETLDVGQRLDEQRFFLCGEHERLQIFFATGTINS